MNHNRIGILSINLQVFSPNYGSTLQSFTLWKTLTDLGYDAELVDYDCVGRRYLDAKKPYRFFRRWCPHNNGAVCRNLSELTPRHPFC